MANKNKGAIKSRCTFKVTPAGVGGQNSWELGGVEMEFLRII
ncbi:MULTISPECIES: hypothetical protein [Providencia]|nr:hypothetical protein [Providencia sp. PROV032]